MLFISLESNPSSHASIKILGPFSEIVVYKEGLQLYPDVKKQIDTKMDVIKIIDGTYRYKGIDYFSFRIFNDIKDIQNAHIQNDIFQAMNNGRGN